MIAYNVLIFYSEVLLINSQNLNMWRVNWLQYTYVSLYYVCYFSPESICQTALCQVVPNSFSVHMFKVPFLSFYNGFKEQQICIKFCFELSKTVAETVEMLKHTHKALQTYNRFSHSIKENIFYSITTVLSRKTLSGKFYCEVLRRLRYVLVIRIRNALADI